MEGNYYATTVLISCSCLKASKQLKRPGTA